MGIEHSNISPKGATFQILVDSSEAVVERWFDKNEIARVQILCSHDPDNKFQSEMGIVRDGILWLERYGGEEKEYEVNSMEEVGEIENSIHLCWFSKEGDCDKITWKPPSLITPETTTDSGPESGSGLIRSDTSGTMSTSERTEIKISNEFKNQVYERFNHCCPLTHIERREILTVSHVIGRSENPDLAEDIENVILLDWTHHMAFDADLWTFDESGRIWINPDFDTGSQTLVRTLTSRHGKKVEEFTMVANEYIERHNEEINWWPPDD